MSRSIETFLGGPEASGPEASEAGAPAGADGPASAHGKASAEAPHGSGAPLATPATTVALIAVDGLPRARRGRAAQTGIDDHGSAAALAMVERAIRSAARGTDVVSVTADGRYRIVLPGTGEVAARAYLRRIRATVEPILESVDRPLHLAVATATVLDEPIGSAVRRASARLAAARSALDAPRDDTIASEREAPVRPIDARDAGPRAAPD